MFKTIKRYKIIMVIKDLITGKLKYDNLKKARYISILFEDIINKKRLYIKQVIKLDKNDIFMAIKLNNKYVRSDNDKIDIEKYKKMVELFIDSSLIKFKMIDQLKSNKSNHKILNKIHELVAKRKLNV